MEPHLSGLFTYSPDTCLGTNPHSSTKSESLIRKFNYPDSLSGNGGVWISEVPQYNRMHVKVLTMSVCTQCSHTPQLTHRPGESPLLDVTHGQCLKIYTSLNIIYFSIEHKKTYMLKYIDRVLPRIFLRINFTRQVPHTCASHIYHNWQLCRECLRAHLVN